MKKTAATVVAVWDAARAREVALQHGWHHDHVRAEYVTRPSEAAKKKTAQERDNAE